MCVLDTVDDKVVGCVYPQSRDRQNLEHVVPPHSGSARRVRPGTGGKLVDCAVTQADERGYGSNASANNHSAIDCLEQNGCERGCVRPDHYRTDGQFVDRVLLSGRA